ncbi:MAG: hypothetical protein AAFS03_12205, partial [Pseudomonadota bacterium]
ATRDWTTEEFDAFRFPLSKLHWRKNDPRVALADNSAFAKSPGCDEDGQYTYLTAHGRQFLHVVDLHKMDRSQARSHQFVVIDIEKHHVLEYNAGRMISVLMDPDGQRYVAVTEELRSDGQAAAPQLPDGWSSTQVQLHHGLEVPLVGTVTVIRTSDGMSYQGPVPVDFIQSATSRPAH